eukprot:CAMPEP_0117741308 /NCGR_PEP_ID=MMETSP0947-20121206/4837_1 /TAXON_ID=44440 /ORGANISM="Chattonella subsalsa, Strain CCMP2191" /LENGTH=60 /DNA_ID=CAMNT_0005557543 /DNA_START=1471 /DNA_END=1653 /DNA_ORIENTATION=+
MILLLLYLLYFVGSAKRMDTPRTIVGNYIQIRHHPVTIVVEGDIGAPIAGKRKLKNKHVV